MRGTTKSTGGMVVAATIRPLFKEQLIYEQSATRTPPEQQQKRSCRWSRQPLKIDQLRRGHSGFAEREPV
jgi:hypothetical protein